MDLALDEPSDNDEQVSVDGIKFVMEKGMAKNFSQLTIDYSDSWFAKGFKIKTGDSGSS